jgi:hypothetical protein
VTLNGSADDVRSCPQIAFPGIRHEYLGLKSAIHGIHVPTYVVLATICYHCQTSRRLCRHGEMAWVDEKQAIRRPASTQHRRSQSWLKFVPFLCGKVTV